MTTPSLTIASTNGRVDIVLTGEIDLDSAPGVEAKVVEGIGPDASVVTFDLSGVTYIDSIGMRMLFLLAAKLEAQQVPLELVANPGTIARRVMELSGLASVASLKP